MPDFNSADYQADVTKQDVTITVNLCPGCLKNCSTVGWQAGAFSKLPRGMGDTPCDFCAHDIDFSPTLGNLDESLGNIEPPLADTQYDNDGNILSADEIEQMNAAEYNDYTRSIPTPQDWNR